MKSRVKNFQNIRLEKKPTILEMIIHFLYNTKLSFFNLGVSEDESFLTKKLVLQNQFNFTVQCILILLSFILYINSAFFLSKYILFTFLFQLTYYFFQYRKLYSISRTIYFLSSISLISILTLHFGQSSGLYFFFIPIMIQIPILYEENDNKLKFFILSILSSCFAFLVLYDFQNLERESISIEFIKTLNLYTVLGVSLISASLTYIFYNLKDPEPIRMENQKLQRYLEKEVVDRQDALQSMLTSQKMLQEILHSFQGGIVILDKCGYVRSINSQFYDYFPNCRDIGTDLYIDQCKNIYKNSLNLQEIIDSILTVFSGNFHYREIEISRLRDLKTEFFSLKISEIKSSFFEGFLLMHNDISDLKNTKIKLDYFRSLDLSLKTVLPDILVNIKKNGDITDFYSEKTSSLYFPRESMVGNNIFQIGIPENITNQIQNTIQEVIFTGNSHSIRYEFEYDEIFYMYEAKFIHSDIDEIMIYLKKHKETDL